MTMQLDPSWGWTSGPSHMGIYKMMKFLDQSQGWTHGDSATGFLHCVAGRKISPYNFSQSHRLHRTVLYTKCMTIALYYFKTICIVSRISALETLVFSAYSRLFPHPHSILFPTILLLALPPYSVLRHLVLCVCCRQDR